MCTLAARVACFGAIDMHRGHHASLRTRFFLVYAALTVTPTNSKAPFMDGKTRTDGRAGGFIGKYCIHAHHTTPSEDGRLRPVNGRLTGRP